MLSTSADDRVFLMLSTRNGALLSATMEWSRPARPNPVKVFSHPTELRQRHHPCATASRTLIGIDTAATGLCQPVHRPKMRLAENAENRNFAKRGLFGGFLRLATALAFWQRPTTIAKLSV